MEFKVKFKVPSDSEKSVEEWHMLVLNAVKDAVFAADGRIDAPTVVLIKREG